MEYLSAILDLPSLAPRRFPFEQDFLEGCWVRHHIPLLHQGMHDGLRLPSERAIA